MLHLLSTFVYTLCYLDFSMKERIKQIMEAEDMTPARFADNLDIGRAVISHILNGRNNPSLEVITRILTKMPQVNSDWLLTGSGPMYRNDNTTQILVDTDISKDLEKERSIFPDLFSEIASENLINGYKGTEKTEYAEQEKLKPSSNTGNNVVSEKITYVEKPPRKIRQIIIYYDDNTFETFISG